MVCRAVVGGGFGGRGGFSRFWGGVSGGHNHDRVADSGPSFFSPEHDTEFSFVDRHYQLCFWVSNFGEAQSGTVSGVLKPFPTLLSSAGVGYPKDRTGFPLSKSQSPW